MSGGEREGLSTVTHANTLTLFAYYDLPCKCKHNTFTFEHCEYLGSIFNSQPSVNLLWLHR